VGLPVAIAALQILNGKIKLQRTASIAKEVYFIKRVRRLWRCFKEQSMPYFGYSQIEFFSLVKQIRLCAADLLFYSILSCRLQGDW
jgi:hypothetical protein